MNSSTALSTTYEIDEKLESVKSLVKKIAISEGKQKDLLIEQAADLILFIMNKQPNNPEVHFYSGEICKKQKNYNQACKYYKTAINHNPKFKEAWMEFGKILTYQENYQAAVISFQEVLSLDPQNMKAYMFLWESLFSLDRLDEAMRTLEKAISMDSKNIDDYKFMMAIQYQSLGEFEKAKETFEKVLSNKPNMLEVYYQLSQMRGFKGSEEKTIEVLKKKLRGKQANPERQIAGTFALAKLLEETKTFDQAFITYQKANMQIASKSDFDMSYQENIFKKTIEGFTKEALEKIMPSGNKTKQPVFILGFMRSGTTLVENILARHSKVFAAGEIFKMNQIANTLSNIQGADLNYPNDLAKINPNALSPFANEYMEYVNGLNIENKERVTDKLPINFQHIGLIATLFPNAKIIHCMRNPVDTCLSCYFQNFTAKKMSLISCGLESVGNYYRLYTNIMRHWNSVVPEMILNIQYEDLVGNPEEHSRQMLSHIDLLWEDKCLDHLSGPTSVKTASQWQVRQPIYSSSVKKWKKYEKHLGPLITELKKDPDIADSID